MLFPFLFVEPLLNLLFDDFLSQRVRKWGSPRGVDMQSDHACACFVRVGRWCLGSILGSILESFWEPRGRLCSFWGDFIAKNASVTRRQRSSAANLPTPGQQRGAASGGTFGQIIGMPNPPPRPSPEYPEGRDITGQSIEGEEMLSHADYPAAQGQRMTGSALQCLDVYV